MNKTLTGISIGLIVSLILLAWYVSGTHSDAGEITTSHDHMQQKSDRNSVDGISTTELTDTSARVSSISDVENGALISAPLTDWDRSLPPLAFIGALEDEGLIDEGGINQFMYSWLETCLQVAIFSVHVEINENLGQKANQTRLLSTVCDEVFPQSFDVGGNGEDVGAVHAEMEALHRQGSYLQTAQGLAAKFKEEGDTAFFREAVNMLTHSMDTGTIQAAINALLSHGFLDSPLLTELRDAAYFPNFDQISNDVATTLLCDRIGGCRGSDHPMVLQRCFKGAMGCNQPADINDAIYQLTPPVDYEIFWALLTETRRVMVKHRR